MTLLLQSVCYTVQRLEPWPPPSPELRTGYPIQLHVKLAPAILQIWPGQNVSILMLDSSLISPQRHIAFRARPAPV